MRRVRLRLRRRVRLRFRRVELRIGQTRRLGLKAAGLSRVIVCRYKVALAEELHLGHFHSYLVSGLGQRTLTCRVRVRRIWNVCRVQGRFRVRSSFFRNVL